MNYLVEHRKHKLNQYLFTKNLPCIEVDKMFSVLYEFSKKSLPKKKYKICAKENHNDPSNYDHLKFIGITTKNIMFEFNTNDKRLSIHNDLYQTCLVIILNNSKISKHNSTKIKHIMMCMLNKHYDFDIELITVQNIQYYEKYYFINIK